MNTPRLNLAAQVELLGADSLLAEGKPDKKQPVQREWALQRGIKLGRRITPEAWLPDVAA
jgi:hypothetical protein